MLDSDRPSTVPKNCLIARFQINRTRHTKKSDSSRLTGGLESEKPSKPSGKPWNLYTEQNTRNPRNDVKCHVHSCPFMSLHVTQWIHQWCDDLWQHLLLNCQIQSDPALTLNDIKRSKGIRIQGPQLWLTFDTVVLICLKVGFPCAWLCFTFEDQKINKSEY